MISSSLLLALRVLDGPFQWARTFPGFRLQVSSEWSRFSSIAPCWLHLVQLRSQDHFLCEVWGLGLFVRLGFPSFVL
jgi:hypothetical protein